MPFFFNNNFARLLAPQFELKVSKNNSTLQVCVLTDQCYALHEKEGIARSAREWIIQKENRTRNKCSNILSSGETYFCTETNSSRIFNWGWAEARDSRFMKENDRFCGGRMMVYDCIFIDGHTDLHIIRNGISTVRRYTGESLSLYLCYL